MPPPVGRRDFLRLGAGAVALGVPASGTAVGATAGRGNSVILVNLTGGLSHLDSLDPNGDGVRE